MSFVTQGPVPPDSPLFAGRADELERIETWCKKLSCYAAVMGARQTGKTSFLLRFRERCQERYAFACINLQCIDGPEVALAYRYIAEEMLQQLPGLAPESLPLPSNGPGFLSFLRQASKQSPAARLVIVLDEYGSLQEEAAVKLAHTIRPVFNDRFVKSEYQRYFFVLAGATDMLKLTSGENSPLANVTDSIYLPDLSEPEVCQVLQQGCGPVGITFTPLIYFWTSGHPYWTQLLGAQCATQGSVIDSAALAAIVEQLLQTEDRNLPHLLKGFERGSPALTSAIREILHGASRTFSRTDPVIAELELLGAVCNQSGSCAIRNPIYRETLRRHLAPDAAAPALSIQSASLAAECLRPRTIRILHLSDIHIVTQEDARNFAAQLVTDLKQELGVESIDHLIISGDIADHACPEEYAAAHSLVSQILQQFDIPNARLVLVPGNHDINWDLSAEAYRPIPKFKVREPLGEQYIPAGAAGALLRDSDLYCRRLAPFSDFYACFGAPYPTECAEQGLLALYPESHILILALNSCWQLDHFFTERASIQQEALSRAINQLLSRDYRGWLKIAVWHHPVGGLCMNDEFLELLSVNRFAIGMHGHIHQATGEFHRYDKRRGMHIIGAGTFGAPANQQVTGIPLQYNFLELDPAARTLTLNSRRKEKRYGAWSADARWGDKNNPVAWYRIDLAPYWSAPTPSGAPPEA